MTTWYKSSPLSAYARARRCPVCCYEHIGPRSIPDMLLAHRAVWTPIRFSLHTDLACGALPGGSRQPSGRGPCEERSSDG
eukprot:1755169-Rhodomonas_salina.1